MTKSAGVSFNQWFEFLQQQVDFRTGVKFRDAESVREDYNNDVDVYDVIQSIVDDYN